MGQLRAGGGQDWGKRARKGSLEQRVFIINID
jgi:hypothetical protein